MATIASRVSATRTFRIYAPLGGLALAIALAGFWPSYFGRLFAGSAEALPIIHLHAAVFTGWLLLVIAQAVFAATGRTALHVQVGKVGMLYGAVLIVVAVITAFTMFGVRVEAGRVEEAQRELFVPLTDMIVFAPFLAAAWIYRRKPEIHKRLIVVLTTILLIAAVHRMKYFGGPPPPAPILLLVWLSPIYIAMAHDFVKRREIHPAYVLGIGAIMYLKFGRWPLYRSDAWRDLAAWFTTFYT